MGRLNRVSKKKASTTASQNENQSSFVVEYDSNNSGGNWWLSDGDWSSLEAAGWTVAWKRVRWLGALATNATYTVDAKSSGDAIRKAVQSFESTTGQRASDEGCNCCGAPHTFRCDDIWACGEDVLSYLYENVPGSLRDYLETYGRKIE